MEADLLYADIQLRRFIRSQYQNALGYPRMALFARQIARGTISLPPTPEDPILDCVGGFFHGLKQIEKRVITEYYGNGEHVRKCSKRINVSRSRFSRMHRGLLRRCFLWMKDREAA